MSYIDIDDDGILEDILSRKEFFALKNKHKFKTRRDILPLFMVDAELKKGNNLQYHSHQLFVQNFANPNTPYSRLLLKQSTGSGKTIGAIGIAMQFIRYYRMEHYTNESSIGTIYVIAFEGARKAFQKDLLRFPQFGFATRKELLYWERLRQQALSNVQEDVDRAYDYGNKIKKRISNRKGNGFFKFLGYKALVNRLLISEDSLSSMTEEEIMKKIKEGSVRINKEFLDTFKNSLVICDEIHNVYNSLQKNNWGMALQIILDADPSTRAALMSATPINNSPSEIVDLANLLLPREQRISKSDFFNKKILKAGALKKLKKIVTGRVSYLMDKNPKYYPSRSFVGTPIKGIKYLKFVRCPMTPKHAATYKSAYNPSTQTLSQDSWYVLDFILPNPDGGAPLYKSGDIKRIALADHKWKTQNNIDVVKGIPTGEFLHLSNLKSVSNKYFMMTKNIIDLIRSRQGKIMIYHNYVNMSGVLFIREILLRNGIIDEYMGSAGNTLCSACGIRKDKHVTDEKNSKYHVFKPVRFVNIHSELDKPTTEKSIDKYNRASNSMGDDFMILIGSRMIKESYDLKGIRHMLIMNRPDNIPMLIQIMGRAVRKNSHIALPEDMRHVAVSIYTSSLSSGLTYSEQKYKEKVNDYVVIQEIERILNENALDAVINYDTIKPGLESEDLGDLHFIPTLVKERKKTTFTLSQLNLSTFNAYHAQNEIDLVTYIIKRAFVESSHVWKYDDLSRYVRSPDFSVEYDTSLIDENHIVISLSKLLWEQDTKISNPYIKDSNININLMDKLFDPIDKRFVMPNGSTHVISQIGEFYMLMPLEDNNVKIRVDMPYRLYEPQGTTNISVAKYLETAAVNFNYRDKLKKFYLKYKDVSIEHLSDAVCNYGVDFHVRFIEDCISYIFMSLTDWSTDKSEYHDFYFKMLYYYDIIGLVIFAHTTKEFIYKLYEDFTIHNDQVKQMEKKHKDIAKTMEKRGKVSEERDKQNLLNRITRNISKSSCDWCPRVTKEVYERSLSKSLERFTALKKVKRRVVKVPADSLPVGHFLQKSPKFFHPDRGWFSSPEYLINKKQWIENPIIVGYHVKSKTGIHIRFKLRKPVQKIKIYKDARLIEKGSICSTRSKTSLLAICKKLQIEMEPKSSITKICIEIKARLMYLELIERSKGTNIKFFYSHFEMPEDA